MHGDSIGIASLSLLEARSTIDALSTRPALELSILHQAMRQVPSERCACAA